MLEQFKQQHPAVDVVDHYTMANGNVGYIDGVTGRDVVSFVACYDFDNSEWYFTQLNF